MRPFHVRCWPATQWTIGGLFFPKMILRFLTVLVSEFHRVYLSDKQSNLPRYWHGLTDRGTSQQLLLFQIHLIYCLQHSARQVRLGYSQLRDYYLCQLFRLSLPLHHRFDGLHCCSQIHFKSISIISSYSFAGWSVRPSPAVLQSSVSPPTHPPPDNVTFSRSSSTDERYELVFICYLNKIWRTFIPPSDDCLLSVLPSILMTRTHSLPHVLQATTALTAAPPLVVWRAFDSSICCLFVRAFRHQHRAFYDSFFPRHIFHPSALPSWDTFRLSIMRGQWRK